MTDASLPRPGGRQRPAMREANRTQTPSPVVPLAKAEGAFLALAAGDALGWPQEIRRNVRSNASGTSSPRVELQTWTRRTGGRYRPYGETIGAGQYSDDTQLTLAVARSRTNHGADWWKAFMRVELPRWTIYERGGGGATRRAAQAWLAGSPPWQSGKTDAGRRYFDAGGNGVAMRVLPHALFLAGQDNPVALVHDVVRGGAATHGHPRALFGTTVCAYAAWSLARRNRTLGFGELLDLLIDEHGGGGAFPDMERSAEAWSAAAARVFDDPYECLWQRTADEMRQLLEQARNGIRAGALADDREVFDDLGCFGRFKGAGTVTAAGAAYLVGRHAARPRQGVLRAAFERGADTDTLAAVTGGLLGCLAGDEWLPAPWRDVQDAAYTRCLAGPVARGPSGAEQQPVETPVAPQSILTDLAGNGDHEIALRESTRVQATALPDLRPVSNMAIDDMRRSDDARDQSRQAAAKRAFHQEDRRARASPRGISARTGLPRCCRSPTSHSRFGSRKPALRRGLPASARYSRRRCDEAQRGGKSTGHCPRSG